MSKADRTVLVSEIPGELMRYHVESWSRPRRPHVVDLLAYGGSGECSCTDWSTRRGPAVKAGESVGIYCRHVLAARSYFLNGVLSAMANQQARLESASHGRESGFGQHLGQPRGGK